MNKLAFVGVLAVASVAMAADSPGGVPAMPNRPVWAGVMMIIVAGLFLAAATIGPLVAILMPETVEPESHDEHELDEHPHGHGGHH